jgi:hypothetical protein
VVRHLLIRRRVEPGWRENRQRVDRKEQDVPVRPPPEKIHLVAVLRLIGTIRCHCGFWNGFCRQRGRIGTRTVTAESRGSPYASSIGEHAMLFGAFDWTQVLIAGGVGAAIGLVVYVIKRATGAGDR